jgi:alkylation response protein AidB-like acyl-CoA dehydrogenase
LFIEESIETKQFRQELRDYFSTLMTDEIRWQLEGSGPEHDKFYKQVIRQMGTDGWLTMGWPEEYGGQKRGTTDQIVFFEEAQAARVPLPLVTLNTIGPALMDFGTAEQKEKYLPDIITGNVHFAIGYSEPSAGTDLASLKTAAVRDGDDYIINGNKIYTSGAQLADYVWLAVRTDPEAPKHKGITIFIVDTTDPGFSCDLMRTVGGLRTTMSFYEDIRVPASSIVGELNKGWNLLAHQLNHERIILAALVVRGQELFDRVIDWSKQEGRNGERVIDQQWVRTTLAEAYTRLEANRLMIQRMAWNMENDDIAPAFASAIKVSSSECLVDTYRLLMSVVGPLATVRRDSAAAMLNGDLEEAFRKCQNNTFGGGVNEVLREMIARMGLNMPKTGR